MMCGVEAQSVLGWVWDAESYFFFFFLLLFIAAEPKPCCVRRSVGAAGSLCLGICVGAMPRWMADE